MRKMDGIDEEYCLKHPGEFLCLTCKEHGENLCRLCVEDGHNEENYVIYLSFKNYLHQIIQEEKAKRERIISDFKSAIEKTKDKHAKYLHFLNTQRERLNEIIETLRNAFDATMDKLLSELEKNNEAKEEIVNLEKELKHSNEDVQNSLETLKFQQEEIDNHQAKVVRQMMQNKDKEIKENTAHYKKMFNKHKEEINKTSYKITKVEKNKVVEGFLKDLKNIELICSESILEFEGREEEQKKIESLMCIDSADPVCIYRKNDDDIIQKLKLDQPALLGISVLVYNQYLVLAGGYSLKDGIPLKRILLYTNPDKHTQLPTFLHKEQMSLPRSYFLSLANQNRIFLIGGKLTKDKATPTVEAFSLSKSFTNHSAAPSLNEPKFGISGTIQDNVFYVFGGNYIDRNDKTSTTSSKLIEYIEFKDLNSHKNKSPKYWKQIQIPQKLGIFIGVAPINSKKLLVFGGLQKNQRKMGHTFIYNIEEKGLKEQQNQLEFPMTVFTSPVMFKDKLTCFGVGMTNELIYAEYSLAPETWDSRKLNDFTIVY